MQISALGKGDEPRCAAIQPAHGVRADAPAEMVAHRVFERKLPRVTRGLMHGDSRGFVEDKQILVLISNVERIRHRHNMAVRLVADLDSELVPRPHSRGDITARAVEQNTLLPALQARNVRVRTGELPAQQAQHRAIVVRFGNGLRQHSHIAPPLLCRAMLPLCDPLYRAAQKNATRPKLNCCISGTFCRKAFQD
ncbi:hypothetical protein SDC9_145729 [bioreactor metagenome]|uniref:Uncharacterized protein n=1 Tax=bioreactor metagenome TaxID=1076179 RepID=A0A645EB20_9ZZZZ